MYVTKRALPRRLFLRGMGTALSLPLLDAMVPAMTALAQTPAAPVRRLGFIYGPNGVARNFAGINYWTPKGEGRDFELSPILTPLAPYRDQLLVVSGLAQHQAPPGRSRDRAALPRAVAHHSHLISPARAPRLREAPRLHN
jgi:hypothetical protein